MTGEIPGEEPKSNLEQTAQLSIVIGGMIDATRQQVENTPDNQELLGKLKLLEQVQRAINFTGSGHESKIADELKHILDVFSE